MRSVRRVLWVAIRFVFAASACDPGHGPGPTLAAVSPAQFYTDQAVPITLAGRGFLPPPLDIDSFSGAASVAAADLSVLLIPNGPTMASERVAAESIIWRNPQQIDATVPAGLPAGVYDVQVRDRPGQTTLLAEAFTSLGSDRQGPTLTIQQPAPGTVVGPGTQVVVEIVADDGPGYIQAIDWSVASLSLVGRSGECAPAGVIHQLTCSFTFVAPDPPTPLETIQISASSQDERGNQTSASAELQVAWIPGLVSISSSEGPTTGHTALLIQGVNFIDGISKILIDGVPIAPDGGTVMSDQLMSGVTIPHPSGVVGLVVANGTGQSATMPFQFKLPPALRGVSPTSGPETSPTPVTLVGDNFRAGQTLVYVDDGVSPPQSIRAEMITPYTITTTIPPGTGTISIEVVDPIFGQSELTNAFQHVPSAPAPLPDGGGG